MVRRRFLIGLIIILASALFLSNELAYKNFWYWRYWWFDLLMHFCGGLLLGLMVIWLYVSGTDQKISSLPVFLVIQITISAALVLGLLWELFEFGADRFFGSRVGLKTLAALGQGAPDSAGDILFDVFGGLAAGIGSIIFSRWPRK